MQVVHNLGVTNPELWTWDLIHQNPWITENTPKYIGRRLETSCRVAEPGGSNYAAWLAEYFVPHVESYMALVFWRSTWWILAVGILRWHWGLCPVNPRVGQTFVLYRSN